MLTITELEKYLDQILQPEAIADYCPNGLQVAGTRTINKIVTGVSACQQLIDAAIAADADALLVHHGFFWKHEDPCIVGAKHQRLSALLQHGMAMYAYHLPLDVHKEYGNNVQLAKRLHFNIAGTMDASGIPGIVFHGTLATPMTPAKLGETITTTLAREPLHIAGKAEIINTIAWCTGAAQNFIHDVLTLNVDAYLTGEISEHTVHAARDNGIHFYAAGHHATESYGVQVLGEHLAKKFAIKHEFIDIPNPV